MADDRTLEDLAAKFRRFGAHEAPKAPLYARLAACIAEDPEILALAAHTQPGQPVPNLLFATVQERLLGEPTEPLAAFYPEIGGDRSDGDPWPTFRAFCLNHADAIIPVLERRIVQTNEVGRCALLLPALAVAWRLGGARPLALIEFGASAGLNLLLDRYAYAYGDGRVRGDATSTVRLNCGVRGAASVPLPDETPPLPWRLGLDLNPLDVTNAADARWLRALVWPGQPHRVAQLEAAIALAAEAPPPLRKGSTAAIPEIGVREMPDNATACVFHSHTLNQLAPAALNAFETAFLALGALRTVMRIGLEHETGPHSILTLHDYRGGRVESRTLARCDPHGAWLEWLE